MISSESVLVSSKDDLQFESIILIHFLEICSCLSEIRTLTFWHLDWKSWGFIIKGFPLSYTRMILEKTCQKDLFDQHSKITLYVLPKKTKYPKTAVAINVHLLFYWCDYWFKWLCSKSTINILVGSLRVN